MEYQNLSEELLVWAISPREDLVGGMEKGL